MRRFITALAAVVVVAFAEARTQTAGMAYRERAIMDGLLCAMCKPIVEEAEEVGIEYSDQYLRKEIDKNCADLGFFKQICIDQMEQVVEQLDQYIKEQYSPEICCEKVGLCAATEQ